MNKTTDLLEAAASGRSVSLHGGYSRRRFLGFAGLLAGTGLLTFTTSSCNKDDDTTPGTNSDGTVNLGSGDTGIMNYAYALEQLEAAFYTKVMETGWGAQSGTEQDLIRDIRDHEIAHRELFKALLGSNAIPDLEVDFSSVDFASRDSVLKTARTFEDLGVQAYNGAGKLLTSADNLTLAGKIVSVEARHAAFIRDLLQPGSFADTSILDPTTRTDVHKTPTQVLVAADPFIVTKINAENLPTG